MLEETLEPKTDHPPETRTWDAAVVGAGYVGVPLAHTLAGGGRSVLLIDISDEIVAALNRGESHIVDVPSDQLAPLARVCGLGDDAPARAFGRGRNGR